MKTGRKANRRSRGFSLIELLIVMNIFMIVMGLAVPYIRTGIKAANESSAVSSLRTLSTAQELYRPRQNPPTYSNSFNTLQAAGLLDGRLATGTKDGYSFVFSPAKATTANSYAFLASPHIVGNTGDRWFYVDETGVIRMSETGPADGNSTPLR
jgi:prepilin-type N-terminal cleavage/methylation domain-containing protein